MCEQHALGFAAGLARAGARPIVALYSTFLQRGYDQLFHELALQGLPVVVAIDRAGLVGGDGPTHHGLADVAATRIWPGFVVMAPGDADELQSMLDFAVSLPGPAAVRYPRDAADLGLCPHTSIELGRAVEIRQGRDVCIWAYGSALAPALRAAEVLGKRGIETAVVNARFAKPFDSDLLARHLGQFPIVMTVEEHSVIGGFGSAALEAAAERGAQTQRLHLVGVPDRFIPHGTRAELLGELGLDAEGLAARVQSLAAAELRRDLHNTA
jgi:1-deoxy-D-xylulose-5-phosphate synthase